LDKIGRMKHGDWLCLWLGYKIGLEIKYLCDGCGITRQHLFRIIRNVNSWTPEYRIELWNKAKERYDVE
jgi:hypothetical protein